MESYRCRYSCKYSIKENTVSGVDEGRVTAGNHGEGRETRSRGRCRPAWTSRAWRTAPPRRGLGSAPTAGVVRRERRMRSGGRSGLKGRAGLRGWEVTTTVAVECSSERARLWSSALPLLEAPYPSLFPSSLSAPLPFSVSR
ncbi:hypothetical protein C4D60_Mb10t17580 [Musa balbisiana]|uniref:Uncharacterized protein n=1 Tax=Musa balbisiana TaxID=52838 RepID=A0A4S8IXX8_MUSBA|nr:hypothetical protein C4D60_Mb10t17580 [Musa balbisiana]